MLFVGDGDVGGGDDKRRLEPDRSEAGLSLRRRETDRTRRTCMQSDETKQRHHATVCRPSERHTTKAKNKFVHRAAVTAL